MTTQSPVQLHLYVKLKGSLKPWIQCNNLVKNKHTRKNRLYFFV